MSTPPPLHKLSLSMAGSRSSAFDMACTRLVLVGIFFGLCFLIVALRVADLCLVQGYGKGYGQAKQGVRMALSHGVEDVRGDSLRADIVDRNGVFLATTLETPSLYADPALIRNPEDVARELTAIFPDMSYADTLEKLKLPRRFVWLRRNLTPDEHYALHFLGRPGLAFRSEPRRFYPQGRLTAHVVGYTDIDGRGLSGVERAAQGRLAGGEPSADSPLRLALDVRVQHVLRRELLQTVSVFKAKGATGILFDIRSGDVLASVSLPDFDPHAPAGSPQDHIFNRATLGVYEAASVFKLFSTAAWLEQNPHWKKATFDAREPLKRGRFRISDFHPQKRILSVPESFAHSSNIASALMGESVGGAALRNFYQELGFFERVGGDMPEKGHPLTPRPWRDIHTITTAYGHGISVTPLHIVVAAGAVLGDGHIRAPRLMLEEGRQEAHSATGLPLKSPESPLVSPETTRILRQLMRLAVTDGTGRQADVPAYETGGKTGTAEKVGARGYERSKLISSFLGVFPAENPRYVILVMVDEPKGTRETAGYATGGWVAAPAAGRVIAGSGLILGMEPKPPQAGMDRQDFVSDMRRYMNRGDASGMIAAVGYGGGAR